MSFFKKNHGNLMIISANPLKIENVAAGTSPNDVVTKKQLDAFQPQSSYKVYAALLTQSSINAPVATVLENTLGVNLIWSYSDVGSYFATASASLGIETNNTQCFLQGYNTGSAGPALYETIVGVDSTDTIYVTTLRLQESGGADLTKTETNGILYNVPIRIYYYG
jgi:hypothetical protein